MSEETVRLRPRLPATAPPPSPLDDDDLLQEILLRLPPHPSSLPTASAVCKRWHRLVLDPGFRPRFCDHHREPPLLGFFLHYDFDPVFSFNAGFRSTHRLPAAIPADRFLPAKEAGLRWEIINCCKGLVLFRIFRGDRKCKEFLVVDPISGDRRRVHFPLVDGKFLCATVVPVADDRRLFCLVAVFAERGTCTSVFASVYSSEAGVWGDYVSTLSVPWIVWVMRPAVLASDAVHWFLDGYRVLMFHLEMQRLEFSELPLDAKDDEDFHHRCRCQIVPAGDSRVGLAVIVESRMQLWEREIGDGSDATWLLTRTFQLDFLPFEPQGRTLIVGVAEENNSVLVWTRVGLFMVHLKFMHCRKVFGEISIDNYYPYSSF
ncbi:uncharacterized protein LOC102722049 [Oryza brachyantha]|uniref:Uncharacterized protein n=1 Tax=Oryza brachyantha TaxID=4533 RepID=J3N106_ORYBR|nr:uncharacterized protein LOC102722049 [Oryza brachyantha]